MPWYMHVYVHYTHLYNWNVQPCYSSIAAFKDCYIELMAYTVLGYSYWVSFHNAYQCQGHAHKRYQQQLLYSCNNCRSCWPNHMVHITPLVINSLLARHTHTHMHTHTQTYTHKTHTHIQTSALKQFSRNQACAGLCLVYYIYDKYLVA